MSLVNRNVNRSPFSNLEMSRGKSIEFGFGPTWVYIPAGLLTSWVALDLGRELTRTQCPHSGVWFERSTVFRVPDHY